MARPAHPLVVVPSRLASTRLPNKPLADIHGQPMIVQVWRRAMEADIGPVVVACGDPETADAVTAAGGRAVLTDPDLPSGSDRVWAAVQACDPDGRHDAIVNLQGDLPAIAPADVRRSLAPLDVAGTDIGTLAAVITDERERTADSVTKAIVAMGPDGRNGRALYFTRATAPTGDGPLWHHIGIYAYTRAALQRFVSLPPSALEIRERLEQLRALEAGMTIGVALVDRVPLGVDTPADLDRVRAAMA